MLPLSRRTTAGTWLTPEARAEHRERPKLLAWLRFAAKGEHLAAHRGQQPGSSFCGLLVCGDCHGSTPPGRGVYSKRSCSWVIVKKPGASQPLPAGSHPSPWLLPSAR